MRHTNHWLMNPFVVVPILLWLALAIPPAVKKKSWLWFFAALFLSFAVVLLPLFIFIFSAFLTPEAKDECRHGWLDCFMEGKLALLPLALYAAGSLYAVEVLRVPNRARPPIVFGLWSGAIISGGCLVYGFICFRDATLASWLLVPFYVAVWYTIRAVQLTREGNLQPRIIWYGLLGSLPFWLGSIMGARSIYKSLPDTQPGCFIVTAAGRGHRKLVGPFLKSTAVVGEFMPINNLLPYGNWRPSGATICPIATPVSGAFTIGSGR